MRMLIYGTDRVGRQVLHLLTTHYRGRCSVAGFVDDQRPPGETVTGDLRVLGDLSTVARFPATSPRRVCLVPALDPDDQPARGQALDRARRLGYRFPILVHPDACVEPDCALGAGVIVQAGVLVSRSVQVGDFCHLESGVIVGGGSRLAENVHLAAGVTLGEQVRLGRDVSIGLHATVTGGVPVQDGAVIAPHALVGATASAAIFDEVCHA